MQFRTELLLSFDSQFTSAECGKLKKRSQAPLTLDFFACFRCMHSAPWHKCVHPSAAAEHCAMSTDFRVVWTDDEVGASIRARWAEGGCPAATFAEFEAMCWAWWRSDPLVMNADGHVGYHDKLCALRTRPRPIQLEAYDINLLQQMAAKVGASAFATKQQLVEAIFRGEFEKGLCTKRCRTGDTAPGSVPMTREEKKKKPKQYKEPKGDPRAPFRPPKKMASAGPTAEPPAAPTNVVELDEDD